MPNPKPFEPMLAATLKTADKAVFPLLASYKLDGIRVIIVDGVVMSRYMKPIPNRWVQKLYGKKSLNGLDGELIVGDPTAPDVFRKTSSGTSAHDGQPEVTFYAFDHVGKPSAPFIERYARVGQLERPMLGVIRLEQYPVATLNELLCFQREALDKGYEGVMLRTAEAPYKYGRGTLTKRDLMKLKTFADAEAVIAGVEEQMENTNEKTADAFGRAKRSSHKAGKVGKGTLGAVQVQGLNGPYKGAIFSVGSGFTDDLRAKLWAEHNSKAGPTLIGKIIKYKYFPSGSKDAPRFPVFLGFRSAEDMP